MYINVFLHLSCVFTTMKQKLVLKNERKWDKPKTSESKHRLISVIYLWNMSIYIHTDVQRKSYICVMFIIRYKYVYHHVISKILYQL